MMKHTSSNHVLSRRRKERENVLIGRKEHCEVKKMMCEYAIGQRKPWKSCAVRVAVAAAHDDGGWGLKPVPWLSLPASSLFISFALAGPPLRAQCFWHGSWCSTGLAFLLPVDAFSVSFSVLSAERCSTSHYVRSRRHHLLWETLRLVEEVIVTADFDCLLAAANLPSGRWAKCGIELVASVALLFSNYHSLELNSL